MDRTALLRQLQQALVVEVSKARIPPGNVGLILVDVVAGFTRQGNLADPRSMAPMVQTIGNLVRQLDQRLGRRLHLLVLRDCHPPDVPEPPYPPHCIAGSGEEELDPDLGWLLSHARTTVMDKDCINGFVGAMLPLQGGETWRNVMVDWIREHRLMSLMLAGDCTDICVSDLALTLLSARNHGMLTGVDPREDRQAYIGAIAALPIFVYIPGSATYHLDPDGPMAKGREILRHPGPVAFHVGLWMMASRGAQLVDGVQDG